MEIGWIAFLFVGLIAGWLAEQFMGRNHGLLMNLLVGIVGAYLGAFLASLLGFGPADSFFGALVVATVGACVLLFIVGAIRGRSA
jgi:uncharacterized membrane protein YeaQ/YmgE (transglycosylase-associated protein family)